MATNWSRLLKIVACALGPISGFRRSILSSVSLKKWGLSLLRNPKAEDEKKQFSVTGDGEIALRTHSLSALENIEIKQSGLLLGMLHWPFLPAEEAIEALQRRAEKLQARIEQLERERFRRQPLPDYVDRVFDAQQGQLRTEAEWVEQTKLYFHHI